MLNYVDLYLGSFLILCGFALSLFNLRRIVKESKSTYPLVLLSENIILASIGIAFILRFGHNMQSFNTEMDDIEERSTVTLEDKERDCNFMSLFMSYGPLIVSLVNSFLSLIIDNYMHYRMIADVKKDEENSSVRPINEDLRSYRGDRTKILFKFLKKYFTSIAVSLQWLVPILIALPMYLIDVKESNLTLGHHRNFDKACMVMMDMRNDNCSLDINTNYSTDLRNYIPGNYYEVYETSLNDTDGKLDSVVSNVYKIISNLKNEDNNNSNISTLFRKPKSLLKCMKVCYVDNKNLILYVFAVVVISFFVPITISTVILTKIHMMDIKKSNIKTYVSRELLYNIIFWTPVMFDTFLSITLCSYTMNGMRTSIFNVIANVYQAIKNFMNTNYFKGNAISPV